jgi:hypothetical protein
VSSGGGIEPVWHPKKSELFYRTTTTLMTASLASSPEPAVVRRDSLFTIGLWMPSVAATYDVMPDGDHFVTMRPITTGTGPLIVLNWLTELREQTAAK